MNFIVLYIGALSANGSPAGDFEAMTMAAASDLLMIFEAAISFHKTFTFYEDKIKISQNLVLFVTKLF